MISLFHNYVYSFSNIMFQFNNFWSAFSAQSMCSILGQAKIIELGVSHKEPSTLEESHTYSLNSCNYRSSIDTAKKEVGIHCEGCQRKMISDNSDVNWTLNILVLFNQPLFLSVKFMICCLVQKSTIYELKYKQHQGKLERMKWWLVSWTPLDM